MDKPPKRIGERLYPSFLKVGNGWMVFLLITLACTPVQGAMSHFFDPRFPVLRNMIHIFNIWNIGDRLDVFNYFTSLNYFSWPSLLVFSPRMAIMDHQFDQHYIAIYPNESFLSGGFWKDHHTRIPRRFPSHNITPSRHMQVTFVYILSSVSRMRTQKLIEVHRAWKY